MGDAACLQIIEIETGSSSLLGSGIVETFVGCQKTGRQAEMFPACVCVIGD
jgi:hypothetical protein